MMTWSAQSGRSTCTLTSHVHVQTACSYRWFPDASNTSAFTSDTYSIEYLLHEWLLQSPHRVLDPDQADFFYVPVYTSCFMHPVLGWADFPWWYGPEGAPSSALAVQVAMHSGGLHGSRQSSMLGSLSCSAASHRSVRGTAHVMSARHALRPAPPG